MPVAYTPPSTISPAILSLVAEIAADVGRLGALAGEINVPKLHRKNRMKAIHASLAIQNNTPTLEQVAAVIVGSRVLGKPSEIHERIIVISDTHRGNIILMDDGLHAPIDLASSQSPVHFSTPSPNSAIKPILITDHRSLSTSHFHTLMPLSRFLTAQQDTYATALAELRAGWKQSHWSAQEIGLTVLRVRCIGF